MSWKIAARKKWAALRRPPARISLAARLTFWYALSAFSMVLLATAVLYWVLVTNLDRVDDQFLHNEVQLIRTMLHEGTQSAATLKQEVESESAVNVRVLDANGRLLAESLDMGETFANVDFPPPTPPNEPLAKGIDVRAVGGRLFRILSASTGAPPSSVVHVAVDRTDEGEILANYRRYLWITLGVALVACSVAGHRIARRGIRPVQQIMALARRIRSTTLDNRLDTANLPGELAALAETFNEMLDRLEESFARLSRFSDDIAHELRTPVNNLRGEAEVALSRTRDESEYRDALGSCLEESQRLSRIIDGLLLLARTENPQTHVTREEVDVSHEIAALREYYEIPAAEAGIQLVVEAPGPLPALVNRPLFQRAVGNLVENALAHTPRGGTVSVSALPSNGDVRVQVSDTGCGIPSEHLARIFDRFYRVDPARSTHSGGVGLGLSIVKSIAALHGGVVEASSEVGRGTSIVLSFPAQPVEPSVVLADGAV
jgi:two-component system, OmpR family, heavy metal sensor histidine kinase CusS